MVGYGCVPKTIKGYERLPKARVRGTVTLRRLWSWIRSRGEAVCLCENQLEVLGRTIGRMARERTQHAQRAGADVYIPTLITARSRRSEPSYALKEPWCPFLRCLFSSGSPPSSSPLSLLKGD
jgi:hypothetical protein